MDDSQKRKFRLKPLESVARLVLASVVDDQDFEVASDFADLVRGRAHYPLDSVLIVVRRKEGGK
jgi:hypothetical protein